MAIQFVSEGMTLIPSKDGNFIAKTSTVEMAHHVAVDDFLDYYKGVPDDIRGELAGIRDAWRHLNRWFTPSVNGKGTTLYHVLPLLQHDTQCRIHVLLACHFYGLFGAVP